MCWVNLLCWLANLRLFLSLRAFINCCLWCACWVLLCGFEFCFRWLLLWCLGSIWLRWLEACLTEGVFYNCLFVSWDWFIYICGCFWCLRLFVKGGIYGCLFVIDEFVFVFICLFCIVCVCIFLFASFNSRSTLRTLWFCVLLVIWNVSIRG